MPWSEFGMRSEFENARIWYQACFLMAAMHRADSVFGVEGDALWPRW